MAPRLENIHDNSVYVTSCRVLNPGPLHVLHHVARCHFRNTWIFPICDDITKSLNPVLPRRHVAWRDSSLAQTATTAATLATESPIRVPESNHVNLRLVQCHVRHSQFRAFLTDVMNITTPSFRQRDLANISTMRDKNVSQILLIFTHKHLSLLNVTSYLVLLNVNLATWRHRTSRSPLNVPFHWYIPARYLYTLLYFPGLYIINSMYVMLTVFPVKCEVSKSLKNILKKHVPSTRYSHIPWFSRYWHCSKLSIQVRYVLSTCLTILHLYFCRNFKAVVFDGIHFCSRNLNSLHSFNLLDMFRNHWYMKKVLTLISFYTQPSFNNEI